MDELGPIIVSKTLQGDGIQSFYLADGTKVIGACRYLTRVVDLQNGSLVAGTEIYPYLVGLGFCRQLGGIDLVETAIGTVDDNA